MGNIGKKLRHELKYFINGYEYTILRSRLRLALGSDTFSNEDNDYHIRSLYFDDIYNSCLFEKLSGVEERRKYRMRIYNLNDNVIKLEKKSKKGQLTSKETSVISRADADRVLEGDIEILLNSENPFLRSFYFEIRNNLFKPVVIVDYIREAYVHNIENVRITFDKGLSTGLHSTDIFNSNIQTVNALDEPNMIMEIKFDRFLPAFIKDMLQIPMRQRTSISKYTICRKFNKTNSWEDN